MSLGNPPDAPSSADLISAGASTAASQLPYNVASQRSSMVNQTGPTGSTKYDITGYTAQGTPIYTAKTTLTPAQQDLLERLQGTQKTAGGQAGTLLSGANYGSESPAKAIGDIASGMTGQLMTQQLSFLKPFFDTQDTQLDAQLKNQGFKPGDPAYDTAMRQNKSNQGLQVNQYLASTFPQTEQIAASQYEMPEKMALALAGFGAPQSPTTGFTTALPGLSAPSTTAGMSALQQQQALDYQSAQAKYNAAIQGAFGLGSNVLQGMMLA